MAPLDHCSLSACSFPPSPSPLIVLLTLCASPLPLAHVPRAARALSTAGEVSGRQRRVARHATSPQGREETSVRKLETESIATVSKGTALCPPTGAAPTESPPPPNPEQVIRTTARTSPSFTPLIPGLIAGGIGITLVPQRPWVPHVPFREPRTTTEPYFEEEIESNVTGRVGSSAYLDCKIEMQQELAVTWLHRKNDSIQLLTVGHHPYSKDSRFLLSHQHPNNWRLQIFPVMKRDEGLYECQIATHPVKVRKIFFRVTAPELKIVDEDCNELVERHYKAGSKVKLTCLATQLEEEDGLGEEKGASEAEGDWRRHEGGGNGVGGGPSAFNSTPPPLDPLEGVVSRVLWRHGYTTITRSSAGKTIRPESDGEGRNVSVVLIFHAIETEDEGNYTCSLGSISSATVYIKILNVESDEGNEDNQRKNTAALLGELGLLSHATFLLLSIFTCHFVNHLLLIS